jgi:glucose/arabinose dehydrogenase
MNRFSPRWWSLTLLAAAWFCSPAPAAAETKLELRKGDKIVLIGNTLAERMQYYNHWETLLHSRFPDLDLTVRNLGWSADELTLRPRSQDFKDHGHNLTDHKPDVILAFFGFNESFGGEAGLAKFQADLDKFIADAKGTKFAGKEQAPQLVLVSPIAHENLKRRELPDGTENNRRIALYTEAMREAAAKHGVLFVDVFAPSRAAMEKGSQPLTINGVHLNRLGDEKVGEIIDIALFGARPATIKADLAKLKGEIDEKNLQHFYDYRSVNGFYIYGGRKNPFGVVNFPAEFAKLRKMIEVRDGRVWKVAKGETVPAEIDDSGTGELVKVPSNVNNPIKITSPEESRQTFKLPEGYEANLFASEVDFPDLQNPVQMSFDTKGRLWVCTMPSYPQYLPGVPVNDKLLILEDTNGDGKADKQTVFADKLHLPTGFEFAEGGVYIAQQPNILFLKDTTGDDRADVRELVLHGFDSADSHHSISAFTLDQGGALYFQEGTFHHSQIETPYGPVRLKNAGIFRFEPRTWKLSVFVSYGFANPWGHYVDKWGQNLVADASGGANYYGTAFSGDIDYPDKRRGLNQFLNKQWRPTSGCELVSSRNFPAEAQGNYLLNNCIGFHGTLQYRMREDGSGFAADPVQPLVQAADTNFRPVDLEFGPDGALYLVDWFNPLIGHMQHSLRDPKRDTNHGRVWRIHYTKNPLVAPAKIAGEPIPALLELLKVYEDRTRYRARIELRERKSEEVLAELKKWTAGLDKQEPNYWLYMTEALWVHQSHDMVNEELLQTLLRCPDHNARAAATRVLCYWRDRVAKPLDLLRVQATDEHPRVRLEAVRACSFFRGEDIPLAQEIVLESTLLDQDYYLKYVTGETTDTLNKRARRN